MKVIKRDGREVNFNKEKITNAILAAFKDVDDGIITDYALVKAFRIAEHIEKESADKKLTVEEIQDMVEDGLMRTKRKDVAKSYILFREQRNNERDLKGFLSKKHEQLKRLIEGDDEESNKENSNKDTTIIPTMRDYIAGFTCKELIPYYFSSDLIEAHTKGKIHIHDTDYSPVMPMSNCCLVNLEDMLQNGTVISGTMIEKPHGFLTSANIATQIITQVASSQYGGTSINMAHLAPFVEESRIRYREKYGFDEETIEKLIKKEIADGVQTIQYQLITMSTTNGQAPFITVFLYLGDAKNKQEEKDLAMIIEEVFKQRIAGVKNELGVPVTTAFPKLIYVLDENNIHEDSEYWYLTKLAAECSAKRLVPDYISAKVMRELKGDVYSSMGCRSFLAPDPVNHKYWGKFNQGVVTINLPYIALESKANNTDFFELLKDNLQLCYKALMIRHNRLVNTKSDVAPILWQHGALARLKPGETIDCLLDKEHSSISLGYAGLWETVYCLTGKTLLDLEGKEFGLKVLKMLNDACDTWKEETDLGFSVYGTPIESTTYKFAKALQRDFEFTEGVNDKNYITNSYHITPSYYVDAFTKLSVESEFQRLSQGGAISYIETPNMTKNIPAILEVMKHIYNTIMYAEINTLTSYCKVCGCTDLHMEDDLKFHCPKCGNDDFNKQNIAVRVCGYISTNPYNDGRAQDIHDRVWSLGVD